MLFWLRLFLLGFSAFMACNSYAQCLSGTLSVTGAGCGCLAGCNLSAYGGPNCGSGVIGNCAAGQVNMAFVLSLEPGCEVTVEARMAPRPGCSSSGADSGDRLRVRDGAGTAPWQTGAANAAIFDSHTQTGGTIVVEGSANRADEIITYEVFYVSGSCMMCLLLPVELIEFNASANKGVLFVDWTTASETNNLGFFIELSSDAMTWSPAHFVEGQGTTLNTTHYDQQVTLPVNVNKQWYVRLVQEDYDGQRTYLPMVFVQDVSDQLFNIFVWQQQIIVQNTQAQNAVFDIEVFTADGKLVLSESLTLSAGEFRAWPAMPGLYIVRCGQRGRLQQSEKVFVGAG